MTPNELKLLTALRSMSALHDLDSHHLGRLAAIAVEVKFTEGEIIYREGDMGKAIYLIEEGHVAIEMNLPDDGQVTVLTLGPGQLFGWSSLFPPRRKTASARALTPTIAIALDSSRLRDLFQSDHTLEYTMMRRVTEVVADRMKATRAQLANALSGSGRR